MSAGKFDFEIEQGNTFTLRIKYRDSAGNYLDLGIQPVDFSPVPITYGEVFAIGITTAGSGYTAGSIVVTHGSAGTGFAGTYTVDGSGAITSITITSKGSGYTASALPTVTGDAGGSSAALGVTLNSELWQTDQSWIEIPQTSTTGTGEGMRVSISTLATTSNLAGRPNFTVTSSGIQYVVDEVVTFSDPGDTSNTAELTMSAPYTAKMKIKDSLDGGNLIASSESSDSGHNTLVATLGRGSVTSNNIEISMTASNTALLDFEDAFYDLHLTNETPSTSFADRILEGTVTLKRQIST